MPVTTTPSARDGALGEVFVFMKAGPGGTEGVVRRDAAAKRPSMNLAPGGFLPFPPLTAGTHLALHGINDGDTQAGRTVKRWGVRGAHRSCSARRLKNALISLSTNHRIVSVLSASILRPVASLRATDMGASIVDPPAPS